MPREVFQLTSLYVPRTLLKQPASLILNVQCFMRLQEQERIEISRFD